jgi:hypothetical protein
MGILSFLFGSSGANGQVPQFVSEAEFESNYERQTKMAPETVGQLRQYGVTPESELRLEYFFYTTSQDKAQALAAVLEAKGYSVEFVGPSASDASQQVITGWTTPMLMETEGVVNWTGDMTRLGYEHDCEFDGWGTNPSQ